MVIDVNPIRKLKSSGRYICVFSIHFFICLFNNSYELSEVQYIQYIFVLLKHIIWIVLVAKK